MKKSFITKLLTYAGAVLVQRSWRDSGKSVSRDIRSEDPDKIKLALKDGWVITFLEVLQIIQNQLEKVHL